jgi:DNA-binding transcriptional MerR regulator
MEKNIEMIGLIDALVDLGISLEEIGDFVGVEVERVTHLRRGNEGAGEPNQRELERILSLHRRESIKSLYRQNPYISQQKASELLKLTIEEFKTAYVALVGAGVIQEHRVKPIWAKSEILQRVVM